MPVKLNSLQVCFGLSILFHLLIIGAVRYGGWGLRPPKLPEPEPVITLTLEAAPKRILATPARPAVSIPTPPKVEPVKTVEPVVPIAKVEEPPAMKIADPVPIEPVVKPTPPEKVCGDGSSTKPGLDLTTTPAQPLVKAQPDYLKNPDPPYPPTALRRHQEGQVQLAVKVSAQGRAENVEVKKSSGFPLLDEAALKAVRDWEFEPAKIGLFTVESEIEVPVRFKLTE